MFIRAIFIRPESELIRETVGACAKLFVYEESTWHKSNRGRTNTLTDSIRKRHKKDLIFLCVLTPLSAIFQLYHGYQKGGFSASFV
jgi:hypothetical protein